MNSKQNVQSYGRFKSLPWFDKISQSLIFVGGAGGISSHVIFQLARTGANVVAVDMDVVSAENLAGQMYGKSHIGMKKVKAMSNVIDFLCGENNFTGLDVEVTEEGGQWQSIIQRCGAVVVGFDNLKARKLIYDEWKASGKEDSIFIDGRLSSESFTVYLVTKNSTEEDFIAYEQTYFPDSERVELPCTMKATTHCGAGIAWWITTQISNHMNNIAGSIMSRPINNIEVHGALNMIDQPVLKPKLDVVQ